MIRYFNRAGMECPREESDAQQARVARNVMPDGKVVSTVFLYINHAHVDRDTPVLFETAVFPDDETFSEIDGERYYSEDEAREGHARYVRKYGGGA